MLKDKENISTSSQENEKHNDELISNPFVDRRNLAPKLINAACPAQTSNFVTLSSAGFKEKIAELEELKTFIESEKSNLVSAFWNHSEVLYQDLRKEFDDVDRRNNLKLCLNLLQQCKYKVKKLVEESNVVTRRVAGLDLVESIELGEIPFIIERESLSLLGEPHTIRKRLSNIRLRNDIFVRKIQDSLSK